MLCPGRRTVATTYMPGVMVLGTFGPTAITRPKFSWPVIRNLEPGGASPYLPSMISRSVPSTPTRSTCTSTPRPPAMSSRPGLETSSRCIEWGVWGNTASAFMCRLLQNVRRGTRRMRVRSVLVAVRSQMCRVCSRYAQASFGWRAYGTPRAAGESHDVKDSPRGSCAPLVELVELLGASVAGNERAASETI